MRDTNKNIISEHKKCSNLLNKLKSLESFLDDLHSSDFVVVITLFARTMLFHCKSSWRLAPSECNFYSSLSILEISLRITFPI